MGKDNIQASILRSAFGLVFFSVIITLEGQFRAATLIGPLNQGLSLSFPAAALVAGGVCEIFFGLVGIFLAGAFAVGVKVSKMTVIIALAIEAVLGWFVFLLFIFVNPAMEAYQTTGIPYPWYSRLNFNAFTTAGILASAGYCATLLGGQFSFTAAFLALVDGNDAQDARFFRSRGAAYSALFAFTGVWLLVGGAVSTTVLPGPVNVIAPPMFIIWPGIFIATGCLAIFVGGVGIISACLPSRKIVASIIGYLHILNALWQISVMALYQPPVMGYSNSTVAIVGIILAQLLPAYFHAMRAQVDGVLDADLEMVSIKNAGE